MANAKQIIDAEPIKRFIEAGLNNPDPKEAFGFDAIQILAEIEFAPEAVVRCRDCRYRGDSNFCPMCFTDDGDDTFDFSEDIGFCHKGKRREENG